jgi:hypothetical protein
LIAYSAVTVHGGASRPAFVIRWYAAVQLLWQSSSAPTMPPFSMPGNAWWCGSGCQSATTSSPSAKLRTCRPRSLAGPQPKQMLCGE